MSDNISNELVTITISTASDNLKANISDLITSIQQNSYFSKLIIYSLNTLKSHLVLPTQSMALKNSIAILKCNFIEVICKVYQNHIDNEEVLIKIGEILFYITSNLAGKWDDFEIFDNRNGITLIKEIIAKLSEKENQIESKKIFLKIFQIIIDAMQQSNRKFNHEEYMCILSSLIDKYIGNDDLMIYLLETIKKLFAIKKQKEILTKEFLENLFQILSKTSSHKIASLSLQILDLIVKSADSREMVRSSNPISLIVKLMKRFKDDNLLSFHACGFLSKILEKDDVEVFLKIMKIKNSKILESDTECDLQFESSLTEIREMFSNQDDDSFNLLKKNITRVLILMSKDKNFLQLLKDINSLDIFVGLLKSDLETYSATVEAKENTTVINCINSSNNHIANKDTEVDMNNELYIIESMLPDLLGLVLSLLKNYYVEYEDSYEAHGQSYRGGEINNQSDRGRNSLVFVNFRDSVISRHQRNSLVNDRAIFNNVIIPFNARELNKQESAEISSSSNLPTTINIKDVYYCLFKSLQFFYKEKQIVYDIFDYITSKEKRLIDEFVNEFKSEDLLHTLVRLFKEYHNKKWFFQFCEKISASKNLEFVVEEYLKKFVNKKNNENFYVINQTKNLTSLLESITLFFENEKKEKILNQMYETSFILFFNLNIVHDENSFQELFNFLNKFIDYIEKNFSDEKFTHNTNLIDSLVNIIFTFLENSKFGVSNIEEKCQILIKCLKKISFSVSVNLAEPTHTNKISNEAVAELYKFILLRLNRLIEKKLDKVNKIIFEDENVLYFIIQVLSLIKSNKKDFDDQILKETLSILNYILTNSSTIQISRFLKENGLILIMQMCAYKIYDYDVNRMVITMIQSFSKIHFKESALIFKNFLTFRKFLNELQNFNFSKGINEKIYYEILVFMKNLIKSCEYVEAVEDTSMIEHLVKEYNDIYCFYMDTRNRILEIISEIFGIFSTDRTLLKSLLNSKVPMIIENILRYISDNQTDEDQGNGKIIEHITEILSHMYRTRDYTKMIYHNHKNSLESIKNIMFHCKLSETCLCKLLAFSQILIEFENNEIKDRIFSQIFYKELSMIISSNSKTLKETIEQCLNMIENPFADNVRKSILESNSKLIKELSQLAKSDRKNAIKQRNTQVSANYVSAFQEEPESVANVGTVSNRSIIQNNLKRKSLININENLDLKNHFQQVVKNIFTITDYIMDEKENFNKNRVSNINIEVESEQLSDMLKILCIFAKNVENVKSIYESGVIDRLIFIMEENNFILTFAKDQGFNLIGKLIAYEEHINLFYQNGRACEFFLKELDKISKFYLPDSCEYMRNKVYIITQIISKLSEDKIFILNNGNYLSVVNIFNLISAIQCDKEIILNILCIFNNIIANSHSKIEFSNLKISFVINLFWQKYSDIRVIGKLMKLIQILFLEESIIRDLLDYNLIDKINEILVSATTVDSESIYSLLELVDILMFHRFFAAKIIETKTLRNLCDVITVNMFNTKIIEKSISIFVKGSKLDKNFVFILGGQGVSDLCLQILCKYMTTCHSNIIKLTQELIFLLISDDSNLQFFSEGQNMDIMLKTFKLNLKNKEQVLLSLKLINVVTTKDIEILIEKRDKKNTITKKDKNKQRTVRIKSTSGKNHELINPITYDFTILIEIINDILSNFDEYIDIIIQLCDLINNLFIISSEIWLKKFMLDVIVNNADKYLLKQDYIEIFLTTMYMMIKSDKVILDLDCSSVLYYISKILSVKLNYAIILKILKILKQIGRSKNVNTQGNLSELLNIMKFLERSKEYHDDNLILVFSQILGYICVNTSSYKDLSNEFISFLLEYLVSKPSHAEIHVRLLEDLRNISVYFCVQDNRIASTVAFLLNKIFHINKADGNKKNLMNVFQIISAFCIQSELIKIGFNDLKFSQDLKDMITKDNFDDTLLNYQAKGCLLNLKLKKNLPSSSKKLTAASTLRSMSILMSSVEIKEEVKEFLIAERAVKTYSEKGEVKKKFILWNDSLDKFGSFAKKNNISYDEEEMDLKQMDSCVRSCGTAAFSKAKGLFTKKPKPAKCFSILGVKSLNGQRTFNVECEKEEDCIKYVDYISILIQNYKTAKEDSSTPSSNTDSISFSPYDHLK